MTVEYQSDEILIRLPNSIQKKDVQIMMDYFKAITLLANNKGSEEEALKIAKEVDQNWWNKNKDRFVS
ncbi:MAG: hypothetical protein AAF740_01135 [Bacteroidota bacterium]